MRLSIEVPGLDAAESREAHHSGETQATKSRNQRAVAVVPMTAGAITTRARLDYTNTSQASKDRNRD
jgi:hypothetical protein